MILALDTADSQASVALYANRLLAETIWRPGREHSTQLLSQVEALFRWCGASPRDLEAIAVVVGPGSFTGLRVGIASCQGLCLALDIPAVPVTSLEVLALGAGVTSMPVFAAMSLGRNRYAVGQFLCEASSGIELIGTQVVLLADLPQCVSSPSILSVDLDPLERQQLESQLPTGVSLASPALAARRAGLTAQMGQERLRRGLAQDAAQLQPYYIV